MKWKISAALICLLLAHPAAAQSVKALARQYVELPAVQAGLAGMQSPTLIANGVVAQLPRGVKMSPAKKAAIGKAIAQQLAKERPAMEKALVESAAKTYTAEELKAMIAFASTRIGASATSKGTVFALTANSAMAPAMQRMQARLKPQLVNILMQ